jgi:hypothetical protein
MRIAICGLDCSNCQAFQATQANDPEMMRRVIEDWRKGFNNPTIDTSYITCDGCTTLNGRMSGYCQACEIHTCGLERGLTNCAACSEYACEKLGKFFVIAPQARLNLEALRK